MKKKLSFEIEDGLILLILFHLVVNIIWVKLNNVPPSWDASLHTLLTVRFANYLKTNLLLFNPIEFLKISEYYPPLVYILGIIFAFLGNNNYKVIQLTGTLFLGLMIFFQYLYVKEWLKNKKIALLSAFFLSFFITIFQQSRNHMLDIPLTAFLLGGLYFLQKSNYLSNKKSGAIFFIFFSLAFLTKWYSLVYFFIPLVFTFINILKRKKLGFHLVINFIIGLVIFLAICSPWYFLNLNKLLEISKVTATPELADPQKIFSLESLFFNLKLIIMFQTTFIGFLVFLFSLVVLIKNLNLKAIKIIFIIGFNYLFFSLIPNKNIRYTIPLMPFFSIIMAWGFESFLNHKNQLFAKGIRIALVIYYFLTFSILSFAQPIKPEFKYSVKLPVLNWLDLIYLDTYPVKVTFDSNIWPNKLILKDILKSAEKPKENFVLLNLVDREYLNGYNLDPLLYSDLPKETLQINLFFLPFLAQYQTEAEMTELLEQKIDYILIPQNYIGLPEAIREYPHILRFQQFLITQKPNHFIPINSYLLPEDNFYASDILWLYKKTSF